MQLAVDEEALKIQEEKQVEQAVNLDRKAYIESVLYKTMKEQKQMLRQTLLDKVHASLIFPHPLSKVESCLQTLLLRGLLEELSLIPEQNMDVDMELQYGVYIKFAN